MPKKNILLILIFLFLIIGCSDKVVEKEQKDSFNQIIDKYENCKTDYEKKNNYKPIIDVKNGTNRPNLADLISKQLKKECYDSYAGNWDNNTVQYTHIIIDSLTKSKRALIKELKNTLDFEIKIDTSIKTCNRCNIDYDITLVIGKDYK